MNTTNREATHRQLQGIEHGLGSLRTWLPLPIRESAKEPLAPADWEPSLDLSEDDEEYLIEAELPDVGREDLSVTVSAGVLTLKGVRRFKPVAIRRRYLRAERRHGPFIRRLALPEMGDTTEVHAVLKDGVLSIRLRKTSPVASVRIVVTGR